MKFWNWLNDEQTNKRILRLDRAIGANESWLGDEVTPKQFREELNSGTGDIELWINSPGGDIFAAVEIYNMLKGYAGKITVKIDALAASSASVVAMAGDSIEISPLGTIMIHNPTTITAGDAAEFQSAIGMLRELKETIITAYELKTHLPRKEISRMMDEETWLNAQKAVELGFADSTMYSGDTTIAKPAQIFSQRRAENALASALAKKNLFGERRVATALLRSRLDSIAHDPQYRGARYITLEPAEIQGQFKSGLKRPPKIELGARRKNA